MPHMCEDIVAALQDGKTVIIDHVITSFRIWQALCNAASGFQMKTVLVSCDVETLCRRETERGDRCAGSAEASLQYLYPKTGYDLCIDSSELLADQPVIRISHIGSTAIQKIWAKNIVDVMVEIPQSVDMKDVAQTLEQNGYIIMSPETKRISLNKGYSENGFADKVYHIHLRYARALIWRAAYAALYI